MKTVLLLVLAPGSSLIPGAPSSLYCISPIKASNNDEVDLFKKATSQDSKANATVDSVPEVATEMTTDEDIIQKEKPNQSQIAVKGNPDPKCQFAQTENVKIAPKSEAPPAKIVPDHPPATTEKVAQAGSIDTAADEAGLAEPREATGDKEITTIKLENCVSNNHSISQVS